MKLKLLFFVSTVLFFVNGFSVEIILKDGQISSVRFTFLVPLILSNMSVSLILAPKGLKFHSLVLKIFKKWENMNLVVLPALEKSMMK